MQRQEKNSLSFASRRMCLRDAELKEDVSLPLGFTLFVVAWEGDKWDKWGAEGEQQKETDCDSYFTTLTPKSSVTVPDVSTRPLESICNKPSGTKSNPSQLNFP